MTAQHFNPDYPLRLNAIVGAALAAINSAVNCEKIVAKAAPTTVMQQLDGGQVFLMNYLGLWNAVNQSRGGSLPSKGKSSLAHNQGLDR